MPSADVPIRLWFRRQLARWHYRQGLIQARKAVYRAAIAHFDQAELWHPHPSDVCVARGLAHWRWGNGTEARQDFERAIALNPYNAKAYGNRGLLRYQQGDTSGALDDWQTALRHRPGYAEASYNRGLVYAQQQNYAAALADFDRALQSNPNLAEAYYHRGTVRHSLGDREGAIKDWELALCNDLRLDQAKARLLDLRQSSRDAHLTQTLQAALNPYQLTVQARVRGTQLDVLVHRALGVAINYRTLPEVIRAKLVPLGLVGLQWFQVIGRVGQANQPDWQRVYSLYEGVASPPSRWREAIATTLLFPPLGFAALLYAAQVKALHRRGHHLEAVQASNTVRWMLGLSVCMMGVCLAIGLGYLGLSQGLTSFWQWEPTKVRGIYTH